MTRLPHSGCLRDGRQALVGRQTVNHAFEEALVTRGEGEGRYYLSESGTTGRFPPPSPSHPSRLSLGHPFDLSSLNSRTSAKPRAVRISACNTRLPHSCCLRDGRQALVRRQVTREP
ncbi:hypothetical protein DY000_02041393 [Brassica cretica]|uniref:Uncharacterized protein n=1 Tax=Brassica cretica TaxID=69181 RepID=A0ABQ7BE23_BRACR|nr:hypothetical protein DY000_02041393 [Brassica cretica]